jgi:hypothetical protein
MAEDLSWQELVHVVLCVTFWVESVHGRGLTCICPFGFS